MSVTEFQGTDGATRANFNARIQEANKHISDQTVHTTTLTCTKSGTVYALTGLTATAGIASCVFKADADYAAGDTFTINGTGASVLSADNSSVLPPGFFSTGETVFFVYDVDGHKIYFSKSANQSGRMAGTVIGQRSTAEGEYTTASGAFSHAEGRHATASGESAHAEGYGTASGNYSHSEADGLATGTASHAEGWGSKASGSESHAEGQETTASGEEAHSEGMLTNANVYTSHVQGRFNKQLSGSATYYNSAVSDDAMAIGNGTNTTDGTSNCFRVTFDGKVYGLSAFNSSGADYSEFFEWLDENPSAEDRVGHFVTLDGEKIKYANDGDYIVGITSGNPAVIGDHPSESWHERYLRDAFGRLQYEDVVIPAHEEKGKDGNVIRTVPEHTETHFKVNPDYDPTKETEYENREKRPEWSTVGLMGKLVVIDDGTCTVNGYCKPKNGIATKADTGYRVMARLDETRIKVLMK